MKKGNSLLNTFLQKIGVSRGDAPTVISLGQVWLELTMNVRTMPQPGEFTTASHISRAASGSFQVLQAASRMGARCELASIMGTGSCAEFIDDAMKRYGITHTGPTITGIDNGFRIVLRNSAEKSFVAYHGAEARGEYDTFRSLTPQPQDVVHISGNALMNESSISILGFLQRQENRPDKRDFNIVLNPTNNLHLVSDQLIENMIIARPIWSMNRQEARTLARRLGLSVDDAHTLRVNGGFDESMQVLCEALREALHAPLILRAGSRGAWVTDRGIGIQHIVGFPTKAVHTRSAGPVHTGALCALLAEGYDLVDATKIANAAASLAISHNKHGIPYCPPYEDAINLVEKTEQEQSAQAAS